MRAPACDSVQGATATYMRSLESTVPPPAVVLVMAVFMWLISRAAPSLHFDLAARNWLAVVLVSVGFVTGVSGVVTFRNAKTTTNPMKPHASSLVTWGVYAISRNPMYLGGLIMLVRWAMFLLNGLAFLFLPMYVLTLTASKSHRRSAPSRHCLARRYVAYQARDDG